MPEPISSTWIKAGISTISFLGVICVGLLIFIWQSQVKTVEKLETAIELVETKVSGLEGDAKARTTNIAHIQTDIREIKLALIRIGGSP